MADQSSRGGQKQGNQKPNQPEEARGTTTQWEGERSDRDVQRDQKSNPDDARRQPTDQQR
jgi:hypothetical protein